MKEFRNVLRRACRSLLGEGDHALLFSGGTDSLTVLWTLLDLGVRPKCYIFKLAGKDSEDARVAALASETWDVELVVVEPPVQNLQELAQDVGTVVQLIGSNRKTHVEVMWGYWHLFERIGEGTIWSGLQADTLYGSSRSMAIKYSKDPAAFREARQRMTADPDQEGFVQARRIAEHFGKRLCAPYTDAGVREFMLRFSWAQLNRPKQKMPAVLAFGDEFRTAAVYRRNDNMQCGSGTREHMARLLADPVVNPKGWRSPAKLYAELGKKG